MGLLGAQWKLLPNERQPHLHIIMYSYSRRLGMYEMLSIRLLNLNIFYYIASVKWYF